MAFRWSKERVIAAYQRATVDNGGVPVGLGSFSKVVPLRAWRGKYFARFSDLVRDAGYVPRTKNLRHDDDALLEPVAGLVRKLGRLLPRTSASSSAAKTPRFRAIPYSASTSEVLRRWRKHSALL